ncbi:hypothetical protein Slin15195_G109800 [Septoria linicola]|uniref:Uncharacterized protein n=1 Tax=Septoria linicola TaxID=215465 RepID=A0A9Q9ENC4_9PEZI|nr:hypothetical protein Slin14017_G108150 [Septoria linicola]USW57661.1 hypothetical protein Slin15195_G109800 [Septoria linicola]
MERRNRDIDEVFRHAYAQETCPRLQRTRTRKFRERATSPKVDEFLVSKRWFLMACKIYVQSRLLSVCNVPHPECLFSGIINAYAREFELEDYEFCSQWKAGSFPILRKLKLRVGNVPLTFSITGAKRFRPLDIVEKIENIKLTRMRRKMELMLNGLTVFETVYVFNNRPAVPREYKEMLAKRLWNFQNAVKSFALKPKVEITAEQDMGQRLLPLYPGSRVPCHGHELLRVKRLSGIVRASLAWIRKAAHVVIVSFLVLIGHLSCGIWLDREANLCEFLALERLSQTTARRRLSSRCHL